MLRPRQGSVLTLLLISTLSTPPLSAAFAQHYSTATSPSLACRSTMAPEAPEAETSLPRWDLSRFGFETPHHEGIDVHLDETKKLAEGFKVSLFMHVAAYFILCHFVFDIFHILWMNYHLSFQAKYEGNLDKLSLLSAIQEYEQISIRSTLVSSYLHLSYDTSLDDDTLKKRKGALSQRQSEIYGDNLEWFSLDVAELDDELLKQKYDTEEGLVKYKSYIEELRRQKPHNLSKDVERALTVRSPYVGTRPLVSFFDKELSLMRFKLDDDGEEVNMEVLLSKMQSSTDAAFRAKCLKTLNDGLAGSVARTAALSLSAVAGGWLIENKERKYETLRSRRNLDNNCPDAVVDSLLDGVRKAGVPLCKRFYALKKGILQKTQGLDKLRWSDRNAPIDIGGVSNAKISWEKAVEMVEKGYSKFSPTMSEMFMSMVNEKRIDVPATNGKKGGAYCAGVVPGVGPFQLLNFDGTKQDVATLGKSLLWCNIF